MFDSLKEQITHQNLLTIKLNTKQINQLIKHQPSINPTQHQHQEQSQQDSLSDYELEERQEMFNLLIQNQQQNNHDQSSPYFQDNTFKIHTNNYYTSESKIKNYLCSQSMIKDYINSQYKVKDYLSPMNKIKELQRTLSLSQQKLKLNQQSHMREVDALNHKHSLAIHQMNIKIQKLSLILRQQNNKNQRIQSLLKQTHQLKSTLQLYQDKYWKYQQLQQSLKQTQQSNHQLIAQNTQLKNTLQLTQSLIYKTQNQHQSNNTFNNKQKHTFNSKSNHRILHSHQLNESQFQQNILKIKQLQKHINKLQDKLTQLQNFTKQGRLHHQHIIDNYQLQIQQLSTQLQNHTRIINQSQQTIYKLQQEKDKLQKSLLFTMDTFSKHLANQSTHIYQQQFKHMSQQKMCKRQTQPSIKHYHQPHQQQTINLDLNQSLPNNTIQPTYIRQISPVQVKHALDQQTNIKYLSRHDYLPNSQSKQVRQQIQSKHQRTRIMSHQVSNKYKINQYIVKQHQQRQKLLLNDPEKQTLQQSKITKLQKKLQTANMKIVQLLKQKLQKGAKLNLK